MKKPNVKLTNPATCRIVAGITGDPAHQGKCPIMMTRAQWEGIKPLVNYKKEQRPFASDYINDLMSQFGMMK